MSLPPLRAGDKTSGTRYVSGVPPARQKHLVRLRPTPGWLLLFCYRFAIHLLPKMPFGLPVATLLLLLCYPFATPLLPVCYSFAIELLPLPFCAPSTRHVSDVYIAAPQGCPFRIPVIAARCPPALNRPPLPRAMPCLTAWPTPHGRTVNCAPVHRYRWGSVSLLTGSPDFSR